LFKAQPGRFEKQIIVTGTADYVYKVETSLLKIYGAAQSEDFYNTHNNDNLINPKKAAMITVFKKSGVHSRTKSEMTNDSNLMVGKHLKAKTGMFSKENMEKSHNRQKELGVSIYSEGARRRGGLSSGKAAVLNKTGIHGFTKEQRAELGRKVTKILYKCLVCGRVNSSPHLANHFKYSGHFGKVRL